MGIKPGVIRAAELQSYDIKGVHKGTNYVASPDLPDVSITMIDRVAEKPVATSNQNIFYFVVSGEGDFEINGQTEHLGPGDMLVAPKGVPYNTPKGVKLLAISNPRFE